jgi:hypothetical protein
MRNGIRAGCFLAVIVALAGRCRADWGNYSDFAFGIGYAHIQMGASGNEFHDMDALRVEPAVTFSPFEKLSQLRLGGAFGVTMVLGDSSHAIISNNGGLLIYASTDIPFLLLEPEFRVSWRQEFDAGFFIEPGVGLGGAIGQLHLHNETSSIDKWDANFAVRGFLNVGFLVPGGIFGVQASYMHAGAMRFAENVGGTSDEFYIGVFGSLMF